LQATGDSMISIFPRRDRADVCPGSPASQDLLALEAVFRRWVQGRARPEVVLIDPDGGSSVTLEDVLGRLCTSSAPLGAAGAQRLGLGDDATIGHAATELLFARHDPDGPRCRSFRSASYYLYGLARISAMPEAESPRRPRCLQPPAEPSVQIDASGSDGHRSTPDPATKDDPQVRVGVEG
jgi:hypothetical protein